MDWHYEEVLNKGITAFVVGLVIGLSSCSTLPFDRAVSASEGNAKTIFFSSPGVEPARGYSFLELRETASPTDQVTMTVPNVACKRKSCVEYQMIRLDGSFGKSGALLQGVTQVSWPISDIIGSDGPLNGASDGEYQIVVRVYFIGPDGEETSKIMKGYIRVVILTSSYQPVGCNDPNIAWEVKPLGTHGCSLQWTTALRSAKCGRCLSQSL